MDGWGVRTHIERGMTTCLFKNMYSAILQRPKTSNRFATLMELYEKNYMLMRLLAPQLRAMDQALYISSPGGAIMPLEISGIEHNRYTTTFNLTYRFSSQQRHAREPDLMIRMYHDARTCEVMSGLIPSLKTESRRVRDLMEGHRLNRFLHKWLSYCLRQGHGFDEQSNATPVADDKTLDSVY